MFAAPLVLLGLLALPGLYFLLRVTPPPPRRIAFPPLALLRGLEAAERTPRRMPLWLLLLRLLAAALVIVGLAGPSLHPQPALPGDGPVLLVIDNGWASATDWPARRDAALRVIAAAARAGRGVAILATARNAANAAPQIAGVMTAAAAQQIITALQPEPWPVDRAGATTALAVAPAGTRIYIADGITDGPGFKTFLGELQPDRVISDGVTAALLLPPHLAADGGMVAHLAARPPGSYVLAETAAGAVLARAAVEKSGDTLIDLPPAVSNMVARLVLEGPPSAGGTVLLDGQAHGVVAGLAGGGPSAETPYLGALFYLRRALPAGAVAMTGDLPTLIAGKPGVIILADVPLNAGQIATAQDWVAAGGVLVRFAGPLTADAPDALTPDPLLAGDRRLSGALTWTTPQTIAPFAESSVFQGLNPDPKAVVSRQMLADPAQLDPATVWASLHDGTPLVLGRGIGRGYLVTVLTSANAEWSGLPLSGLFPAMLARLTALSHGAPPKPEEVLPAAALLSAFGDVTPAAGAAGISAAALAQTQVSPLHPPGLYGAGAAALALNLGGHVPPVAAAALPGAAALGGATPPVDFGPALLAIATALLALDLLLALALRGKLRLGLAALLILVSPQAKAQNAALATTLAYVVTGDAATDQISADGLSYLSALVSAHSSAQLGGPAGVTPGQDDLNLYPLLYWPVLASAPAPAPAFCHAVMDYMRHGGLLVMDTQGGDADAPGSGAGFAPGAEAAFNRASTCLNLPLLEPLTKASVLAHCFYILPEFPGRFTGAPVLLATPAAQDADGVSPVIAGQNDWAGAWARDADSTPEQMPIPGGEDQRVLADRFGTNLVIYALTGSYKADQTNLPALLDRLGQ
jgi:hypothetical protein